MKRVAGNISFSATAFRIPRVSVGDMGEKSGDWGERGENRVRMITPKGERGQPPKVTTIKNKY